MSEVFQLTECCDVFQFTDPADSYATWQGLRGPKGDPGEPGPPGKGLTISGTVATVADLPASAEQGTVYNVGAEAPYELYMYEVGTGWISLGYLEGPEGPAGAAAGFGTPTISVGSGTGTPSATVTASGPDTAKVFAFEFDGLKGAQGDPGTPGQDGADGAAATIAVGTVSGLPAGSTPTVTNSGTSAAAVFNFGIPAGAQGAHGQDGDDGAAAGFGTPTASVDGNVGTPGVTITASGPDTAKVFDFAFTNLKGATGATGQGVPAGGSAGQVLAKASGTDYDTEWVNQSAGVDPATATPIMDGTGAVGSSAKYAREDHVHPSDTSKQDTLVSGTNIKTVGGQSLLGSGNIDQNFVNYASAQTLTTAQKKQARNNIGANWQVVWTNASSGSGFPAQTINLDLSNYSHIMLVFASFEVAIIEVGRSAYLTYQNIWNNGGEWQNREVTVSSTGITFSAAHDKNFADLSQWTEISTLLIPYKIYAMEKN